MKSQQHIESNLSRGQTLLWAGQMMYPEVPLYNMALSFTIDGRLNPERFHHAFLNVVSRCDALRTVFQEKDGIPYRQVLNSAEELHSFVDLSDDERPEDTARRFMDKRSRRVFPLHRPPTDSILIKVSEFRFIWYLNQHHLITDGWSASLVFRMTEDAYATLQAHDGGNGTGVDVAPAYEDYVRYQRRLMASRRGERARAHWNSKLTLSLPPARFYGRNLPESPRTRRVKMGLGNRRTGALRWIARRPEANALTEDLSIFNLLATALIAFLHRSTGQKALALGAPAHGRLTPDHKETVGVFIEVLPLTVEVTAEETFATLLRKVSDESSQHLRYALPGVGSAKLSRSFNVLLNYINARFSTFAGFSVGTDWIHSGYGDAAHHLRLQVHDFDGSGSLQLHFDLNEDVFDEELGRRVIDELLGVLDEMIVDLDHAVAGKSRDSFEPESQSTGTDAIAETVVGAFDRQARTTPQAVAVTDRKISLTYLEVQRKSIRLAQQLNAAGIGAGNRVAVFMRRRTELIPVLIGILRSGAAYVPIDASDPLQRVRVVLDDGEVSAIVTEGDLSRSIPGEYASKTIDVESLEKDSPANDRSYGLTIDPSHPAYLIYTSGSTGRPKGVVVSHKALYAYLCWAVNQYTDGQPVRFPLFTSISFDMTVTSLFVPILCGGQVRVYTEDESLDTSILDVIGDSSVDCIKLTPSHTAMLSGRHAPSRQFRCVIFGGENLRRDVAESARRIFGTESVIYNEYGPTEATVGCAIHRYLPGCDSPSVPIGRPVPYARLLLLDENLDPVPAGRVGEVFVGGSGLATGYWRRPNLTTERFVVDPQSPGELLYRTGDLARADDSGCMTFLGRVDDQIKVRGFRVERAEVESVLGRHPGIESTVVHLTGQRDGNDIEVVRCARCGLSSDYPGVTFDQHGLCSTCVAFDSYRDAAMEYFGTMDDLERIFTDAKANGADADYDCLVLLSGGKDSSYVLYRIAQMGLRPLAFTLDNGFISDGAKANIARICRDLGADHVYGRTAAMNDIFVDSLKRHSNVCNGCFKTIYTLAAKEALSRGIPIVVTGLSRGQLFETRLSGELFSGEPFAIETIDKMVLDARKAYHRLDDAVSRLLDVQIFENDQVFSSIVFVDFYRYCDVELDEMLVFLSERAPWIRPSDTGRSTNCLINEAGIYVHKKTRGYHNYEWPYSWDVRMGHKDRQAALDELDDQIDEVSVHAKLEEVGFDVTRLDPEPARLCAYYTGPELLSPSSLREFLSISLPDYMIPQVFVHLDRMPMGPSGKVDLKALPQPSSAMDRQALNGERPLGDTEIAIASVWSEVLRIDSIGANENFFDLGGDSILAIQIAARSSGVGLRIPPNTLFRYQTVRELADWLASRKDEPGQRVVEPSGTAPLAPAQARLLASDPVDPNRWSHLVLLACDEPVDVTRLTRALARVIERHPVLRTAFSVLPDGWTQNIGAAHPEIRILVRDCSPSDDRESLIRECERKLLDEIRIDRGELLRAAVIHGDDGHYLLLVVHHLAVDGLSWPIVVRELGEEYNEVSSPSRVQSASFRQWVLDLEFKTRSAAPSDAVLGFLRDCEGGAARSDGHGRRQVPSGTHKSIRYVLRRQATEILVDAVPKRTRYRVEEIVLAALVAGLATLEDFRPVLIDVEAHGREGSPVGLDVAETVGWLTATFPILLKAEDLAEPRNLLAAVRKVVRANGAVASEFGALRFMGGETRVARRLRDAAPDVQFNYLGRYDELFAASGPFRFERELRLARSPLRSGSIRLAVDAFVHGGELVVEWTYPGSAFSDADVCGMAEQHLLTIESLTRMSLSENSPGLSAADFDLVKMDETSFAKLARAIAKVDKNRDVD